MILIFWRTDQCNTLQDRRLTASVTMWLHACTRPTITDGLALLASWSVRQKLNRVSSV